MLEVIANDKNGGQQTEEKDCRRAKLEKRYMAALAAEADPGSMRHIFSVAPPHCLLPALPALDLSHECRLSQQQLRSISTE
jgi:hypothetical protein